ncbi:glycosyltransferase family 4 protein [Vagococcus lutrae]|uniref:glycosyltransferase family 4 protein n=1 Tax=Vagococcus lutrae TaxID=81947 RepID=UPI001444210D|nr:glycosyltransferase family 4 protein [Vagococcus lutrae]NKZ28134.1 glycosyltransferase family 4 protein [Vagococcus lutrae]
MKKVLFVATVAKGHIDVFHLPYLKMFKAMGWQTDVVAKNNYENQENCILPNCDNYYDVPFERKPFKIKNLESYFILKKIIKKNKYDIIHCHTPVGGVLARIAARHEHNTKVIYTAHGFHFFKGASLKNWILFYPVEKLLSRKTDILVTMNSEDYSIAKKKFKMKKLYNVPGVGIELEKFNTIKDQQIINELRTKNDVNINDFVLIYVAELSDRKNQEQLILVAKKLIQKIPNLKVLIVGEGEKHRELLKIVTDSNLSQYVKLLGYRKDISDLMSISNIVVSTSKQEGLPVNIIEGLASGKPIVATNVRGNKDLVTQEVNGYLSPVNDIESMANNIFKINGNSTLEKMLCENSLKEAEKYGIDNVLKIFKDIYGLKE